MKAPAISLAMYDAIKQAQDKGGAFSWLSTRKVCQRWSAYAAAKGWNAT